MVCSKICFGRIYSLVDSRLGLTEIRTGCGCGSETKNESRTQDSFLRPSSFEPRPPSKGFAFSSIIVRIANRLGSVTSEPRF